MLSMVAQNLSFRGSSDFHVLITIALQFAATHNGANVPCRSNLFLSQVGVNITQHTQWLVMLKSSLLCCKYCCCTENCDQHALLFHSNYAMVQSKLQ